MCSCVQVLKGLLDFLTSDLPEAVQLRQRVVFKIVPVLNPDGVVRRGARKTLACTRGARCEPIGGPFFPRLFPAHGFFWSPRI
jgi:hypothetical protein